jgi:hypothetical protein
MRHILVFRLIGKVLLIVLISIARGIGMELENYMDRYGRVHDEITTNESASSNNGWLFTAVAHKLGADLNIDPVAARWCVEKKERHPFESKTPPISRDEVLGLVALGFMTKKDLKDWNFSPYKVPKFSLQNLLLQAIKLVDWKKLKLKHRNTFWKEGYDQIYRFAFSVPLSDRHFILKKSGKYNFFYHMIHIAAHFKQPSDRSARLLRFLKTGKDRAAVLNYFGPDHPLARMSNAY